MIAGMISGTDSAHSEQHLKTNSYRRHDGGSTQFGTGTSQQTSQPRPAYDVNSTGQMLEQASPVYGCTLYLEDLQSFHHQLEVPLLSAYQALELTDVDLCQALGGVIGQVAALVESTATVVRTHGMFAQQILYDVLPQFRLTIAEGGANHAKSSCIAEQRDETLAIIKMLINRMKNDAKVVRASYLEILEAVQYLASCTQLALDFYDCSEDPSVLESMAWAPNTLMCVLQELRHVQGVLSDPSDFWLIFHVNELELGRIENDIQNLSKMVGPSMRTQACIHSAHLCAALEQLSLQYLEPRGLCPPKSASPWSANAAGY